VGIGFGAKGMLFREFSDIWHNGFTKDKWRTIIDGVEIFADYITDLQRAIYDNIYIGDIMAIVDTLGSYDLVYAGDIIEHLKREDGLTLVEKLKGKAKTLIIATPKLVYPQGEVWGNPYEAHKSQWEVQDFTGAKILQFGNILVVEYGG